jgi:hypothetical protein
MLSGAVGRPITLAEKRIKRTPYSIYVRVSEIDTLEGIRYRFEIVSNATMSSNLSILYIDKERAMEDYRTAVARYNS